MSCNCTWNLPILPCDKIYRELLFLPFRWEGVEEFQWKGDASFCQRSLLICHVSLPGRLGAGGKTSETWGIKVVPTLTALSGRIRLAFISDKGHTKRDPKIGYLRHLTFFKFSRRIFYFIFNTNMQKLESWSFVLFSVWISMIIIWIYFIYLFIKVWIYNEIKKLLFLFY